MKKEKGIVLTITIIFVIILAIIAGVTIVLATNQARVTEAQIKRVKAFYTAEGGIVEAFEDLRENGFPADPADWSVSVTLNGLNATVTSPGGGPENTREIKSSVSY